MTSIRIRLKQITRAKHRRARYGECTAEEKKEYNKFLSDVTEKKDSSISFQALRQAWEMGADRKLPKLTV